MTTGRPSLHSRMHGCLAGLALGDALGLPTEMLDPGTIAEWYGAIRGLTAIDPRHPHHRLPRGSVSDDTDQAILVAELMAEDGGVSPLRLGERLLAWSETPRVRENNFMGRATRQALAALSAGAAVDSAGRGETIGAAMRIAPVALACPLGDQLVREVVNACMPTHYTRPAISGAMAVAFGVRAALEPGALVECVAAAAGEGAVEGARHGVWGWTPPLDRRLAWVAAAVRGMSAAEAGRFVYQVVGVGEAPWELVTAALALVVAAGDRPMDALLAAANCGGDTDTLGAIAGALAGALHGVEALDPAMLREVEQVNGLALGQLAERLVERRQGGSSAAQGQAG